MANAPRTAWWFGAGASHHYALNANGVPLPLANGFFEAFHNLPTFQGFQAHVGHFISYLLQYREVRPLDLPQWKENVEDFMTSVEAEIDELKAAKATKGDLNIDGQSKVFSVASVFNNLGFILASVVNEAQNGPSESAYRYLLHFCGPEDAFITFNWDTLLDRALVDTGGWSPNDGYGLSFSAVLDGGWKAMVEGNRQFSTNWKLLKLHGSTNWLVPYMHVNFQTLEYISLVPESDRVFLYWQSTMPYGTHKSRWRGGYVPTCYCYYPPNIPESYFYEAELAPKPGHVFLKVTPKLFSAFDEPDSAGIPASAVLITPVRQKKFDSYQSTINKLWAQARDALKITDTIVIIGYSFPPTDTRTLNLLGDALAERPKEIAVEIVAPDAADIISRIGEKRLANARSVAQRNVKFEEYLEILAGQIPALMKKAMGDYEEVREWVEKIYLLNQAEIPTRNGRSELE